MTTPPENKLAVQKTPPDSERGAALLTVLLLVAVMSVIAATALDRLQLSTRLATNGAAMTQARYYSYAAEAIAMSRIEDLLAREPEQLTLEGGWLDREIPIPTDRGVATARIKDANNCFNLNSLVVTPPQQTGPVSSFANPASMGQFARLMTMLQVPENEAQAIAQSAADWIDSDDQPLPSGAEDSHYRGIENAALPANQWMADRSELLAVKGMTAAYYARIAPWVCAVPAAGPTEININTLSPDQAILFAMLFDGTVSIGDAKAILARRPANGYGSLVRFWSTPSLAAINPSAAVQGQVKLKSRFFQLQLKIRAEDVELEGGALIDATPNGGAVRPYIVSRSWGEPI
ncbi:type II secretion system minor pseudopilin GspK [Sphingorhabdus arenilitoris]|uniref:Type II secretion system protein K n=1 Tax=Sphingorhabdus arenilitoris TaxID=1490041 RepID=A0ABV8RK01_9SPHN